MKNWVLILMLVLVSGSLAFAEEMPGMGEDQGQGMMMGGSQGGTGKGKMNPMMMGMMHKDSVVATSDGGVVILSGPRLLKYDASLTLIKEVELPRGKKPGQQNQQVGEDTVIPGAAEESL